MCFHVFSKPLQKTFVWSQNLLVDAQQSDFGDILGFRGVSKPTLGTQFSAPKYELVTLRIVPEKSPFWKITFWLFYTLYFVLLDLAGLLAAPGSFWSDLGAIFGRSEKHVFSHRIDTTE